MIIWKPHTTIIRRLTSKEYLTGVLTRLPGMPASEAASLTPANWLQARSGKPVRKVA